MHVRVSDRSARGNPHRQQASENSGPSGDGPLLSGRSAAILGASGLIAVIAGMLAYLTLGKFPADIACAFLTAGAAFAGAVRLLMAIVA